MVLTQLETHYRCSASSNDGMHSICSLEDEKDTYPLNSSLHVLLLRKNVILATILSPAPLRSISSYALDADVLSSAFIRAEFLVLAHNPSLSYRLRTVDSRPSYTNRV